MLGEEVVPVLRKEFAALRPAHVPSDPPTHASLVAAARRTAAAAAPRRRSRRLTVRGLTVEEHR